MKTLKWFFAALAFFISPQLKAQDGQQLFKAKCSTCHALDRNSTGPKLQGVRLKWEEAGELDYLYKWVENSSELIASDKSQMAAAIKGFSPSAMSAQQVTPAEVDAILAYVDGWQPAPKVEKGIVPEVIVTPNYKENLNMFYVLITVTIFLLIAIIMMSGTVIRFVNSDYFKRKVKENNSTLKTLFLLLAFTAFTAHDSLAFRFNDAVASAQNLPWILVEKSDLYILLTIDFILVGVLIYVRRLFSIFFKMTKEPVDEAIVPESSQVLQKVNKILTDIVPIEEEASILMEHEYDGIRELDNNLPPWWVWGFYATIVFAVIYMFNYHVFKTSDLQIAAYNKDMAQAKIEVDAYLKSQAMNVDENNVTLMTEQSELSTGKGIFESKCVECHGQNGEGNSGPNLTDHNWIYGYDIKDVFTSVKFGRPAGGMPEHKSKLNPIQLQQVASWVLNMPEAKGLEPKGDIVEPK